MGCGGGRARDDVRGPRDVSIFEMCPLRGAPDREHTERPRATLSRELQLLGRGNRKLPEFFSAFATEDWVARGRLSARLSNSNSESRASTGSGATQAPTLD